MTNDQWRRMKRIAVVEDNPDNRLLVRVMLESLYEVTEYETGFAALEGLPKEKPDLVLLDISLPELDGGEVLRRMRADPVLAPLPVIALTAHAMAGDREKYLAAGFNDYVAKPIVDERILLDAIRKQLSPGQGVVADAGGESPPLEEDAVEKLRRLGGDQFAGRMIDLFLDYGQAKILEARRACEAVDLAGVARAVHPVKSSAGNVGATQVQELAGLVEEAADGLRIQEATRLLGELEGAFAEVKRKLEQERKQWQQPR